MATEEELRVTIKTVADTSGAQQVSQSLQTVTAQQEFANRVLRQAMAAAPQTLQGFQAQVKAVEAQIGARPTLGPSAFGITPEATRQVEEHTQATRAATIVVREHAAAQEETGRVAHVTANEFVRFATAAIGVGGGLSIATTAGNLLQTALTNVLQQAIAVDQAHRTLIATFGAAAAQYQQYALAASKLPGGFSEQEILAAVEAVRPLAEQYHLTDVQVKGLTDSAQKLANIHNVSLSAALNAMLEALQGNAAAAAKLGLSMTDVQVAARANAGAYQQVFGNLTDGEKVTLRYIELLNQVNTQQKNIAESGPSVSSKLRDLTNQVNTLNAVLGQGPLTGLLELLDRLSGGGGSGQSALDQAKKQAQDWTDFVNTLPGTVSLTPSAQQLGAMVGPQVQSQARLDFYDQVRDAARNVVLAQVEQTRLQRESVQLSAEEARIKLALLPAQQRMAELQRDMTEQQVRARQAALQPTEVLEDLRYMQQRNELIAGNPFATPEERAAARRELRGLARAAPGVELAALDAGRPVTLAGRAATRLDMQSQLNDIAAQRALAGVSGAMQQNQLAQTIAAATTQGLQDIVDKMINVFQNQQGPTGQPMRVTVNVQLPDGTVATYDQLVEANAQAQTPPTIQVSGVRR